MNQKYNWIFLLLTFLPSPWFKSPSLNRLLICTSEVKLFSRAQSLLYQLGQGKPRHLLEITFTFSPSGRFGVSILREEPWKVLDQEYIIRRSEGWTWEEEATWVHGMNAGCWTSRCELEWFSVEFVELRIGGRLRRCWRYREVVNLNSGVVTSRKIDECSFQAELDAIIVVY